MENNKEMSKIRAIWRKIKDPMAEMFPQMNTDKESNTVLCSQRGQNTSSSYLFACFVNAFPITETKQLGGIFFNFLFFLLDCPECKHSKAQNRV